MSSRFAFSPTKKTLAPEEDLSPRLQIKKTRNIGAWGRNADKCKSMTSQSRPEFLIAAPFRDCNALAVHQV